MIRPADTPILSAVELAADWKRPGDKVESRKTGKTDWDALSPSKQAWLATQRKEAA